MRTNFIYTLLLGLVVQQQLAVAKSININPLTTGMNSSYLGVEDASLNDQAFSEKRTVGRMFLYGTYHWDKNPWVLMEPNGNDVSTNIVSSLHTIDLGFSWLFNDKMQLSVDGFGSLVGVASKFGGRNSVHTGDSRVQLKYRLYSDSQWNLALAPELTVPTGAGYRGSLYGASLTNSSWGPSLKFIGEYHNENNQITFNLGYAYFNNAEYKSPGGDYPTIDGRSRLLLGSGWLHRLDKEWSLDTEVSSQIPAGKNNFTPPGLLTFGGRYQPGETISWHFGAGTGSVGNNGGNNPILYAGFKLPFFPPEPTKTPEPTPTPTPTPEPVVPLYTEEQLQKSVVYKREKIQVLNEVEFDLNESVLTPRGRQIVHQVAKVILDHKEDIEHVNVDGHTDHTGNDKINDPLSQARAESVVKELVAQGVSESMLTAKGFGSKKPLYNPKKTKRSLWDKNRRVEFKIKQPDDSKPVKLSPKKVGTDKQDANPITPKEENPANSPR